ncbi:hypothetical protein PF66_06191 [Pseudomonas asplenii]|uniref:Uncharacterized protein n=1 Tax=Pseudomonas asplenii TaxID=53407 RepID=A0A0M9GC29_9PSED|nr:hypothetical protein PF66_06191 [Pseudomonas fuscovaginae]
MRTNTLVQVLSCTNDGGVSPVGLVDVKVLVQRMDGAGNVIDAGTVFRVPYVRVQGGTDAVIMDPKVGDIGIAAIADRDLSVIKASKAAGAPGSSRKHDMADALYIGGVLNGTPTQYVQFTDGGINLVSPTKVTIQAPAIELDGPVTTTSTVNVADTLTAAVDVIGGGIKLKTHTHTGVTPGSGSTGVPSS